jgi:hypothetical protein
VTVILEYAANRALKRSLEFPHLSTLGIWMLPESARYRMVHVVAHFACS